MTENSTDLPPEEEPVLPREDQQHFTHGERNSGPSARPRPVPGRQDAGRRFDLMTDRELEDHIDGHLDPWGGDEGD